MILELLISNLITAGAISLVYFLIYLYKLKLTIDYYRDLEERINLASKYILKYAMPLICQGLNINSLNNITDLLSKPGNNPHNKNNYDFFADIPKTSPAKYYCNAYTDYCGCPFEGDGVFKCEKKHEENLFTGFKPETKQETKPDIKPENFDKPIHINI